MIESNELLILILNLILNELIESNELIILILNFNF